MDIKDSKSQLSKIIQLHGFLCKALGNIMSNLDKKALSDIAVSLVKDVLPKLETKTSSSVLDKFEEK